MKNYFARMSYVKGIKFKSLKPSTKEFLSALLLILLIPSVHFGQLYKIGNDTIYKISNDYFYITPFDTVQADTSVITINFIDSFSPSSRSYFESSNSLTFLTETAYGNRQYLMPLGTHYVTHCNSIISDNNVETLIKHFYLETASNPDVFEPNDYYLDDQWYLDKIAIKGMNGEYGAWDITKGNSNITVAVLDMGLQWDLEEFGPVDNSFDVVYLNSGEDEWGDWEDPGDGNGQDDDSNDLIDDLRGYDFKNIEQDNGNIYSEDNDVRQSHSSAWHGTAVSGIIAAKTNNDEGIAGIAGGDIQGNYCGVKILPIKVGDLEYDYVFNEWNEHISTKDVERAITYAVDQGANIINMSFRTSLSPKESLKNEIQYAYDNDVFIVAAAGNEGYFDFISYPAKMDHIVAVGATDENDERWHLSNQGEELDLVAPGDNITVLDNDGGTETESGTSFSAPMVAATAALMMSVNPALVEDPERIEEILKETAQKVQSEIYPYIDGWNKRFGYGRINSYAAICRALDERPEITVTSDETWTTDIFSKKNITIKDGAKLTVTTNVYMGENAKIIVEPGAKLIIDGGYLTNFPFCGEQDDKWSGIEVWGTGSGHQFKENGVYQQGTIYLSNNAEISNADCAIRLFNALDWSTTGGMVFAEDVHFTNNSRSVSFFPYKNIYLGNEYDYRSWFKNCTFTKDDSFITYDSGPGYDMVFLYGVKGILFEGCDFFNEKSGDPDGTAINSYNAGFKIDGYCTNNQAIPCPSGDYKESKFYNFYRAIESSNAGNALYTISIFDSKFDNNAWGVYLSAVNDAIIVDNEFVLGYHNTCTYTSSTGLFMDNCKRFAVEENDFELATVPAALINTGIEIYNTNNRFDEIYKNDFDDMLIGIYAKGKNWNNNINEGLAYYCNFNNNNEWDMYVDDDVIFEDGIQRLQGNRNYTAGNIFSNQASWHFDNRAEHELEYYYNLNSTAETPDINKLYRVSEFPVNVTNYCPSHYGGGTAILTTLEKQQQQTAYTSAVSNYNTAKAQYVALGASGDSALRQQLIEQMSYNNMLVSRAAYNVMRSELADTLVHESDVNDWLLSLNRYTADESRIDLMIQQGNYSGALALSDSMDIKYVFSSFDTTEYPYFESLKTLQTTWRTQRRSIFELTPLELSQLSSIADNSIGLAGAQARGILSIAQPGQYQYYNCVSYPDTTTKSRFIHGVVNDNSEEIKVLVKPNPANHQLTFECRFDGDDSNNSISIWNSSGKLMKSIDLTENNKTVTLQVSHWAEGMYYYSLVKGVEIVSGKFLIVR